MKFRVGQKFINDSDYNGPIRKVIRFDSGSVEVEFIRTNGKVNYKDTYSVKTIRNWVKDKYWRLALPLSLRFRREV